MEELRKFLEPYIGWLPPRAREFLDAGGWWVVLGVVAVVVVLLLWAGVDRLLRILFGRRRGPAEDSDRELHEVLGSYPPLASAPGPRRLTVYHLPARVRLVIVAPVGTEAGIASQEVDKLLDRVVPGLGAIAAADQARFRVWPHQLSQQGFSIAFHRRTQRPEPDGEPSHWVLVGGRAQVGRQAVLLGLALWTDEPTTMGRITLEPYQWLDVLRLRTTEA